MKLMALDYGSKTVGVAMTDALGITAQGKEIIKRKSPNKLRQTLARIVQLTEENNVEKIILGLPLNLDGTCGDRVEKTKEFAEKIKARIDIPIEFEDERLTTVEAYEIMDELKIPRDKRDDYVDMIAAVVILEQYMNNNIEEK